MADLNPEQPTIYIVLVNWNGWKHTQACLDSLQQTTFQNKQIIVVDNGSNDGAISEIKARYPAVLTIEMGYNSGFCLASNAGIAYALEHNADYIMLLNNDTIVDKSFIEPLLATLKSGYDAVSCLIYYLNDRKKIWFTGAKINQQTGWAYHDPANIEDRGQFTGVLESEYLTGCTLMAAASTWRQVGMLDERFFAYYEDVDWSVRAQEAGKQLGVVTDSKVWHQVSASAAPRQTGTYLFVRNGLLFISKHITGQRNCVYWRFINQWAIRPTLREIRHGQFSLNVLQGRIEGIKAHFSQRYGTPFD